MRDVFVFNSLINAKYSLRPIPNTRKPTNDSETKIVFQTAQQIVVNKYQSSDIIGYICVQSAAVKFGSVS